jgi:hypothetical protein
LLAFIRNNREYKCPDSLVEDEAECGNGLLHFKDGFWHDGLGECGLQV